MHAHLIQQEKGRTVKQSLSHLIINHKKLHPSVRVRDIYKILHQGTMGPRHLIENKGSAHTRLWEEYESLDVTERNEPLTEPVSMDGSVVRMNLRPFKRHSEDPGIVFSCLIDSAERLVPDESALRTLWKLFGVLNREEFRYFDEREVDALDEYLSTHGFMAISHSCEYRREEKPSYRVMLLDSMERVWGQPPQ